MDWRSLEDAQIQARHSLIEHLDGVVEASDVLIVLKAVKEIGGLVLLATDIGPLKEGPYFTPSELNRVIPNNKGYRKNNIRYVEVQGDK